jgi:hypothetical protein
MEYICKRTPEPIKIDGDLTKPQWQKAEKSRRFVDVIGGNPGMYDTRAAVMWDDEAMYVGFWCEEPFPHATLTERDSLLWFENDLEIFIDGKDSYYELELNALNVIYEVFYIWQDAYKKNPMFDKERFDILENKAMSFGGNFDRTGYNFWKGAHPRGLRWVYRNWDFPGLETAVQIDGKLNDTSVVSRGWTAEIKLPWKGFEDLSAGREGTPKAGDVWKIFFGRYEQLQINGSATSVGWAWDPIGDADNHYPEKFTDIILSDEVVE